MDHSKDPIVIAIGGWFYKPLFPNFGASSNLGCKNFKSLI